jgi:alanine racemase
MNTFVEINLQSVKDNIKEIKNSIPAQTKFMAVVKANAYGHGALAISRAALEAGVDHLAVANLREALELREAGITSPILILTESPTSVADEIVQYDLTQTVYSYSEARSLSDEAVKRRKIVKIHIKVDTGMGRVGILPNEAVALISKISSLPNLNIEGIFTHFARAEENDGNFTQKQLEVFKNVIAKVSFIPLKHAANSAATLYHPESHLDMVRIGLMMYGLYPSKDRERVIRLKPALNFKTRITYLKRVPAGTPLSYGGTYLTPRETTIATLPVGYADGYSRMLSNKGKVLIRGRRYDIVGRVSMDLVLINVGNDMVRIGDEVVLIGEQMGQAISVDEIAEMQDTINYEIVCSIGKRVPRIYK